MRISEIKEISISDFDYDLPDDRIALHPLAVRDSCKLLVAGPTGDVVHDRFSGLSKYLPGDSLLVCNDTRVINARIKFTKDTGSTIEVFLLEPLDPSDYVLMFQARGRCRWSCMVGNLKRWKDRPLTKKLTIDGREVELTACRLSAREGNSHEIEFCWNDNDVTFASIVDAAGYIPIPPYLRRASEESDFEDYQTVYARYKGSVAAPTAGLHFTESVFESLRSKQIEIMSVTLHVGAGTFQPVKSEEIGGHPMHTEVFSVTRELVGRLAEAVAVGRPVTAVGTTSVRTLESLPVIGAQILRGDTGLHVGQWEAYQLENRDAGEMAAKNAEDACRLETELTVTRLQAIADYMDRETMPSLTCTTSIMIAPGFRWKIVDRMVTNFHQPQSTLLLLVSSFLGEVVDSEQNAGGHDATNGVSGSVAEDTRDVVASITEVSRWRQIYNEALSRGYRFLSYGDACLFTRRKDR